jgi:ABC-2 type transport system ATP-binding protein
MNIIETHGLGKRYRRSWALRDCTLAIPAGRVVALVGPNGAGKTTLLHLIVGLTKQSAGEIAVLGGLTPGCDTALSQIGFVAQDTPLYSYLSVADTLRMVASLSGSFDDAHARERLAALNIPLDRKVGQLSGGQRSQVALAVALARHPRLLILDEPVARLDPLARHEFMGALMAAVAEDEISVLLSSHVISELERVCDYLVVLADGRVQVIGAVEDLLETHKVLTGPIEQVDDVAGTMAVVSDSRASRSARLLVRTNDRELLPPGWQAECSNLEEIVLAYLRVPDVSALPGPNIHRDNRVEEKLA